MLVVRHKLSCAMSICTRSQFDSLPYNIYQFSDQRRYIVWVVGSICFVWVLSYLKSLLSPCPLLVSVTGISVGRVTSNGIIELVVMCLTMCVLRCVVEVGFQTSTSETFPMIFLHSELVCYRCYGNEINTLSLQWSFMCIQRKIFQNSNNQLVHVGICAEPLTAIPWVL